MDFYGEKVKIAQLLRLPMWSVSFLHL